MTHTGESFREPSVAGQPHFSTTCTHKATPATTVESQISYSLQTSSAADQLSGLLQTNRRLDSSMVRPIVQISLADFENRKLEIAAEMWKAATEIGFFYLRDTGITEVRPICLVSFCGDMPLADAGYTIEAQGNLSFGKSSASDLRILFQT